MPKYLLQASYTVEGVKGLLKEGGTSRHAAVKEAVKSVGGTIESFYFAFGESDVYVIADLPDNVSMAALALATGASGTVRTKTTVLLTPQEVDAVAKKAPKYRAPGH
ncbi:MAG: GYD domain-containing protein [Rudaea sp.]